MLALSRTHEVIYDGNKQIVSRPWPNRQNRQQAKLTANFWQSCYISTYISEKRLRSAMGIRTARE